MAATRSRPNGIAVMVTVVVVAGVAVAAGFFAGHGRAALAKSTPAAAEDTESSPGSAGTAAAPLDRLPPRPTAPPPAEPPALDAQPHVAGPPTVVSAPPLRSPAEVDAYLMTLEARARKKHQATADEVEPGIKAIMLLAPQIGPEGAMQKLREFNARMSEISAHAEQ